jgi:hypothetical protein
MVRLGVPLISSHEEGINAMDLANLKQVNSDLAFGQRQGVLGSARTLWARWKQVARTIGDFQARALMTLFYFVILGPVALVTCWRSDPLAIQPGTPRGWADREVREGEPMAQARRQF